MKALQIEKQYNLIIKPFLFRRKIFLSSHLGDPVLDIESGGRTITKIRVFEKDIKCISSLQFLRFVAHPYIEVCNIAVFEISYKTHAPAYIMEILDIAVFKKYRNKGLGSQILLILEEIAQKNGVSCVIAELQKEREGEPLNETTKFYEKHGFHTWFDKSSDHSGWLAKKEIN